MGSPTELSKERLSSLLALCRDVVASVEEDKRFPDLGLVSWQTGGKWVCPIADVETLVLELAQVVGVLERERDSARELAAARLDAQGWLRDKLAESEAQHNNCECEVDELLKQRDEAATLLAKATLGGDITNADTNRIAALMKAAGVEG